MTTRIASNKLLARRALKQIALRARLHRAEDTLVGVERREDDHPHVDALRVQRFERLDAIHFRHFQIEQQHVRGDLPELRDDFAPIRRRADDLEIGLRAQNGDQTVAHDRVIVGDEDADAHNADSNGTITVKTVPSPGTLHTSSVPPISRARSFKPTNPKRPFASASVSKPCPSSSISSTT